VNAKKILVVDDEEEIGSVLAEALEEKGFTVFQATNGVEGLRICSENPVDLIILDLKMPRMDGYMFMERLLERYQIENRMDFFPKIIVLSALDSKVDFGLAKNMGAQKYLTKPVKPSELIQTVNGLLML